MHTTTFSQLFDLPDGGSLIDIPGIKGFGTFDMEPEEIATTFATSSRSGMIAASPTAPTPTNPDVLCAKHSKRTALRPRATPLISPC